MNIPLIIDHLLVNSFDEGEIDDLTDQLVYWTKDTAAREGRDLLLVSPPERLNLPAGQFAANTMLRVAESYADDFYPAEFDRLRDTLLEREPGEDRFRCLRGHFIKWLHEQWQKEAAEPLPHEVPPTAKAPTEDDPEGDLLKYTATDPEGRREELRENLRRLIDPLIAWRERNLSSKLWQPACRLLASTEGRLEVRPLRHDR